MWAMEVGYERRRSDAGYATGGLMKGLLKTFIALALIAPSH